MTDLPVEHVANVSFGAHENPHYATIAVDKVSLVSY